jgi:predicted phosphodiesterase
MMLERSMMFSRKAAVGSYRLTKYNRHTSLIILTSIFLSGIMLMAIVSNYASAWNAGVAGDWGCNSNTDATVNRIKSFHTPDRVFALGDYSYQDTATCWLNKISSIKSITRITIGNHEDDSSEGFSQYMSAFGLSKTYYTMTFSNMRVIVMDSDHSSYSSGSDQYNFVISELQKASQDPNIKWIVVYLHKQMYTSPNTCSASSCSNTGSDATNLRNIYHAKFDQYGVDVVFNGHVHNYQRTYPIKYDSGSPSSPIKACSNTNNYGDCQGEVFVTVGTGGVNIHGLAGKSSFVASQQDDRFGAMDLNIENNGDTLAGRYYTNDGVQRDFFKITKSYTSTGTYTFGPSLTLSGQNVETQSSPSLTPSGQNVETQSSQNNGNNGNIDNNGNNDNNGKQPGQDKGQGKGLECEHFTQQGPERCR